MDTLIIGNQTPKQRRAAIIAAVKTGTPEPAARLDFVTLEDAWKILSDKRRALMALMAGAGPLSVREIARRAVRDVHGVHSDIQALCRAGVIDKTDDGKVVLPYRQIRFDFTLTIGNAA